MKINNKYFGHILFVILLVSGCAKSGDNDVESQRKVVKSFYNKYLELNVHGIPDVKLLENFRPFLSQKLYNLLEKAASAEEKYRAKTKNEVPPLVEGDIFTSLFEGALSFKIKEIKKGEKSDSCIIEFNYSGPTDTASVKWEDKIIIANESGNWKIDDIEYLGNWEFMHKGKLSELLTAVIKGVNEN